MASATRPTKACEYRSKRGKSDDFRSSSWRSPHRSSNPSDATASRSTRGRIVDSQSFGGREPENDDRFDRRFNRNTRHRAPREGRSHSWIEERHPNLQSSAEFPVLGAPCKDTHGRKTSKHTSHTPEPLHSLTTNTDWSFQTETFKKEKERANADMMKYKRRLLLSESSDGSNDDPQNFSKVNLNAQPKKEYETDEDVIMRRQKQIEFGKNTLGYHSYVQKVPRKYREKEVHIYTPNKFQKCSRRAWDGIIRQWRRKLHDFDPEGTYQPPAIRKELHFSDSTSEASLESDIKMDTDLNDSMQSSNISDYLASSESSRPDTPNEGGRPDTPTMALGGLSVSNEGTHGACQTGDLAAVGRPDATLTPTVTPIDHEIDGHTHSALPPVNPADLIKALVDATRAKSRQAASGSLQDNAYCPPFQANSDLSQGVARSDDTENNNIFDNFNIDDCFLKDEDTTL